MNNIGYFQEHHHLVSTIFRHRKSVNNREKVFVQLDFVRCSLLYFSVDLLLSILTNVRLFKRRLIVDWLRTNRRARWRWLTPTLLYSVWSCWSEFFLDGHLSLNTLLNYVYKTLQHILNFSDWNIGFWDHLQHFFTFIFVESDNLFSEFFWFNFLKTHFYLKI